MRIAHVARLVVVAMAVSLVPHALSAQWGVGGFIGREFDEAQDWVLFGAHAMLPIKNSPVIINPRVGYHPLGDGANSLQVDVNVLYDFTLAKPGLIRPYLGVGAGYVHLSTSATFCDVDCSSSKLVGDFVAGFRLAFGNGDSPIMPFVNSEYSFAKQFTNEYQLTVGFTYTLKK